MIERIDFTSCRRLLGKAYNGANGKKIAVEYEDRQYMLKFPPSGAGKLTDISYINSCISEHIGSSIFNMLGIPAQQTLLGVFTVNGKEKVVCACGDFTADGKMLYDFCSIKNTVIDSEHGGSGTELSDILESIEKQQFVNPEKLLEHFWNVFVVDALLGNFDRHNGNWGFLYNNQTDVAEIAPIFDCGSCLLPQADEKVMRNVLNNEDELNARIYRFPTSAIKLSGQKVNYYDFLMSGEYTDCNEAIVRIVPKIDMEQIEQLIEETPYISVLQKDFYKVYINARYEKIMLPVFKQATGESLTEYNSSHKFSQSF